MNFKAIKKQQIMHVGKYFCTTDQAQNIQKETQNSEYQWLSCDAAQNYKWSLGRGFEILTNLFFFSQKKKKMENVWTVVTLFPQEISLVTALFLQQCWSALEKCIQQW